MANILYAIVAGWWLLSLVAAGIALWWCCAPKRERFWPGVILAAMGMGFAWLGLTHFHIETSRMVNGVVVTHEDSRWFFVGSLALGTLALGLTIWRRKSFAQLG
jgi:hypothetical protein